MLAHEVLRRAAEVVAAGWSEGSAAARNLDGDEVTLFTAATSGTSRAGVNPAAARFSAYGAVAKVLADPATRGLPGGSVGAIWMRLSALAKARSTARPGGTNHMHPLVQFNADEGRTAEDVVALLLEAAEAVTPQEAQP